MEKTLKSVSYVSFFFFIIFGGLHISSSFLAVQGVDQELNLLLFKTLDLPFLLVALIYGTSKLSLTVNGLTGKLKAPLIGFSVAAGLLFIIALYFNFILPDASLF